jgi:hypothetical protein
VHYLSSSVNGQLVPTPTTVHYDLSTSGVPGSTSGLDLKKQATTVASHPALGSMRTAFFRCLRR